MELDCQVMDTERWCLSVSQMLREQAVLIRQLVKDGSRVTLFVEIGRRHEVLSLGAAFLEVLADLGVSLEITMVTE